MGGLILIFLLALLIVILITPALRARRQRLDDRTANTAHDEVMRRLETHRKWHETEDDPGGRD
jgi:sensor domain CHASE-containing protein